MDLFIQWNMPLTALACAVVGYVWVYVLTEPGMILGFVRRLKRPAWVAELLTCEYCFTGQLALWSYVYYFWESYSIPEHIVTVCLSIFFVLIFNKLFCHE